MSPDPQEGREAVIPLSAFGVCLRDSLWVLAQELDLSNYFYVAA